MEQPPQVTPMPKKSCIVNLMFPIKEDTEALAVKAILDDALKDLKEKRYTFQIIEV